MNVNWQRLPFLLALVAVLTLTVCSVLVLAG